MKKITLFVISILTSVLMQAQDEGMCSLIKYALPQFGDGIAQLDDGSRQSGKFNICIVDQSVHFLSGSDTLVMADNASVIKVTIGKHLFLKERMKYTEVLDMAGDVFLGIEKNTVITDNFKQGAYGTLSATSSIDSYSRNDVTGMYYDTVLDDPNNYLYEETYTLIKGERFFILNKKTLPKCFPGKKAVIEKYFAEHNVNFKSYDDVKALFDAMK